MPAGDRSSKDHGSVMGPARKLLAVTPHDTNELDLLPNALSFGADGTVSIIAQDDTAPVTVTVKAGQILPVRARIVRATGTTATGIVALIS